MFFCQDTDLLPHEPALFNDPAFAGQRLLPTTAATLAGTQLSFASPVLSAANVLPGMVAIVSSADNTQLACFAITAVAGPSAATLSVVPARDADAPNPPTITGPVKVSVVSFRPQIAAVGDQLLAAVGVASDASVATPLPAMADAQGFRTAAVFGTLATLFRSLVTGQRAAVNVQLATGAAAVADPNLSKMIFYQTLYDAARKSLSATVDEDHDGVPETPVKAGVGRLERA